MSIGAELGQYILQTQFKKILKSLGTPVALPKATARVDFCVPALLLQFQAQ